MTAPYDWQKDPQVMGVPSPGRPCGHRLVGMKNATCDLPAGHVGGHGHGWAPTGGERLYPNRLLVPAVRLQRCDELKRPLVVSFQMRRWVQVRWRPVEWADLRKILFRRN